MAAGYKGPKVQVTVRLAPDLHRALAVRARVEHRSLNDVVERCLRAALELPADPVKRANIAVYDDDGQQIGFI